MDFADFGDDIDLLLSALHCSAEQLRDIVQSPDDLYIPRTVKRRTGSSRPRQVYCVRDPLRRIHRTIALWLKPSVTVMDECVHGFRPKRGILSNARPHCGKAWVLTVDLKDFFGTVKLDQVRTVFSRLGAKPQIAMTLARISTYKGTLPQGSRCSPALANLAATDLDDIIQGSLPVDCSYTRYADDLTFSGALVPSRTEVVSWARSCGFEVRQGSQRLMNAKHGQYVTGLSVSGPSPRLPRRIRRSVDTFVRFAERFDLVSAAKHTFGRDLNQALTYVAGIVTSYKNVEPETCASWVKRIDDCTIVTTSDSSDDPPR